MRLPTVSRAAAPLRHGIALDRCGSGEVPPRPYAAAFVVTDSSRRVLMASAESRT